MRRIIKMMAFLFIGNALWKQMHVIESQDVVQSCYFKEDTPAAESDTDRQSLSMGRLIFEKVDELHIRTLRRVAIFQLREAG